MKSWENNEYITVGRISCRKLAKCTRNWLTTRGNVQVSIMKCSYVQKVEFGCEQQITRVKFLPWGFRHFGLTWLRRSIDRCACPNDTNAYTRRNARKKCPPSSSCSNRSLQMSIDLKSEFRRLRKKKACFRPFRTVYDDSPDRQLNRLMRVRDIINVNVAAVSRTRENIAKEPNVIVLTTF